MRDGPDLAAVIGARPSTGGSAQPSARMLNLGCNGTLPSRVRPRWRGVVAELLRDLFRSDLRGLAAMRSGLGDELVEDGKCGGQRGGGRCVFRLCADL